MDRSKVLYIFSYKILNARVAKLVDALCSGRSARKGVLVRIQSRAQYRFFKAVFLCLLFSTSNDYSQFSFFFHFPFFTSFSHFLCLLCSLRIKIIIPLETEIKPSKKIEYERNTKEAKKQQWHYQPTP